MKIETYLPVFTGFYGTVFEPDETQFLEENNVEWEDINWDNEGYQNDMAKACCDALNEKLSDFVAGIKFQGVWSPKEYNFRNDSINCEIVLLKTDVKAIKNYIFQNSALFKEYLREQFTGYPGFIPFYSNDFEDWCEYTQTFTNYRDNSVYLGVVLEFICRNEEITCDDLHECARQHGVYEENYCSIKPKEEV